MIMKKSTKDKNMQNYPVIECHGSGSFIFQTPLLVGPYQYYSHISNVVLLYIYSIYCNFNCLEFKWHEMHGYKYILNSVQKYHI